MKTTDLSAPEWQLLDELEIAVSTDAEDVSFAWLGKALEPLVVPAEFRSRITNSARETIARMTPPAATMLERDHIHLLIFVTTAHASKRSTWGFFHIEKMDGAADESNPRDRSIEFYLYVESQ